VEAVIQSKASMDFTELAYREAENSDTAIE
jgi:hypothetical protein